MTLRQRRCDRRGVRRRAGVAGISVLGLVWMSAGCQGGDVSCIVSAYYGPAVAVWDRCRQTRICDAVVTAFDSSGKSIALRASGQITLCEYGGLTYEMLASSGWRLRVEREGYTSVETLSTGGEGNCPAGFPPVWLDRCAGPCTLEVVGERACDG